MTYNMSEERIKKLNHIVKELREEEEQLILYIRATRNCFSKTKEENMEHLLRCLMQKREWFEGYICGYRRVIFENRDTSKEAQEAMEKKMEKNKEITAIPEEIYIEESEFKQINVRFPQMPCGE